MARRSKKPGKRPERAPAAPTAAAVEQGGGERRQAWAWRLAAAALVLSPLVVLPGAADAFRLPQRMVAEWLGLASLLPLAAYVTARLADGGRGSLRTPVLLATAPLLGLAAASLATTAHPLHVRSALADLAIGVAVLAGWSLGFAAERLRALLVLVLVPASALALVGILQLHGAWRPLVLEPQYGDRAQMTSLLGNPGDLGVYLVLPCLVAQAAVARRGGRRWLAAGAGALCLYGLAATQTLTAVLALVGGSAVLWMLRLPPWRRLVGGAAALAVVALLVAAVPPLRSRVAATVEPLREGRLNEVLTGRLDGWRVAVELLADHPVAGVGHGAYRAEFARAKLALTAAGVPFYERHVNPSFANAHNELLEVGADLGWPGLLAVLWGCGVTLAAAWRARRARGADAGLLWGGLVALALLAMAQFPFRLGSTALPWLAFLAWCFASGGEAEERG